jgi:anti-anti-sigma regulatory factor
MAMQHLSQNVLLITLPKEPQCSHELEAAACAVRSGAHHDVVVDFSLAETVPTGTICSLIILERLLSAAGRQLVLCSAGPHIAAVFKRVGLRKLFRFANDEFAAVQSLERNESCYS